jgi:alkylated DNA repair dioxygenase AlkB
LSAWRLRRGWADGDETLAALQPLIEYREDRATGWLWLAAGNVPPALHVAWPEPFAVLGPWLLEALAGATGAVFSAVCFQAYRDGAGQGWHHDRDWGAQAILSLGVTRKLALRRTGSPLETHIRLAHGDLLYMPPGFQDSWEHCVPVEDVPGERCSLVFRATKLREQNRGTV